MFKKLIAFTTASLIVMASVGHTEPGSGLSYTVPKESTVKIITEAQEVPKTTETNPAKAVPPEVRRVPSKDRYIIRDDPGGSVAEFIEALMVAKRNGYKFRVEGYCASACTLILATPLKLDVCIVQNTQFMFHQPFAMDGYGRIWHSIPFVVQAQQMWDNLFFRNYPDYIKKLITKNGGVPNVYKGAKPSDMFTVKYEDIKMDIPTCE